MKWMLSLLIVVLVSVCTAQPASGQQLFPDADTETRTLDGRNKIKPSTFNFLKVSTNARVASMGDAFTAVADGMSGIHANPAGTAKISKFGYTLGYAKWLVQSEFYSGAIVYNAGRLGVIGLTVVSFQLPATQTTTTLQPDGTGQTIDLGDTAVGFTYAYRLTDKLSAGGAIRYIQSQLGPTTLKAVAINVNSLMYTGYRSLRLGMNLKNLGGEQQIVSEISEMPLVFHMGAAMEIVGNLGDPASLTAAFEGAYFTDRQQRWNLGGELWLKEMIALRAGYKFKYDEQTWSVGAGFRGNFSGRNISLDVSYSDFGTVFDAPLRVSFSGAF